MSIRQRIQQWQQARALAAASRRQTQAFIRLNNLYLAIERHEETLNISTANELRCLATQAYDRDDKTMQDYWQREFEKLPHWFDV